MKLKDLLSPFILLGAGLASPDPIIDYYKNGEKTGLLFC
jgi:hypothetical protein